MLASRIYLQVIHQIKFVNMLLFGVLLFIHRCFSYETYGEHGDLWNRCHSVSTTELWMSCNLRFVVEENAQNSTKEIINILKREISTRLTQQDRKIQRILALVEGISEIEKPIDCSGYDVLDPVEAHTIYPTSCSQPVSVLCQKSVDVPKRPWTIFLQRKIIATNEVDFKRSWSDYRQGFGDRQNTYWLGLEVLHQMTKNQVYELKVQGQSYGFDIKKGIWHHFRVLGEDTQYKLEVGDNNERRTNFHDCITPMNGQMFSTFDRDNDVFESGSCASEWKGGWWYSDCGLANPTGLLTNSSNVDSIFFTGWRRENMQRTSLQFLMLGIRSKDGQARFRKCYGKDGQLGSFDYQQEN